MTEVGRTPRGLLVVAIASLLDACAGKPAAPATNVAPPTLDEVLALVAPHGETRFDAEHVARGCPEGDRLGEYVTLLTSNGAPASADGDVHRLTGGCTERFPSPSAPIDPPADEAHWYCVVDAYSSDPEGESPWNYSLRLRIRRADRQVDLATLACPGGS